MWPRQMEQAEAPQTRKQGMHTNLPHLGSEVFVIHPNILGPHFAGPMLSDGEGVTTAPPSPARRKRRK